MNEINAEEVEEAARIIGGIDGDEWNDLSARAQNACRRAAAALHYAGLLIPPGSHSTTGGPE